MVDELLARIADPDVGEGQLAAALEQLPAGSEPASFWLDIANDPRYAARHRRRALLELFRRHVPRGTTLAELGALLAGADWLRDEDVDVVDAAAGKLPVSVTLDDTVFVVRLLPDDDEPAAVYLRIAGHVTRDDFIAAIRGREIAQPAASAAVVELGWSSD
jgi:hypothetical protein